MAKCGFAIGHNANPKVGFRPDTPATAAQRTLVIVPAESGDENGFGDIVSKVEEAGITGGVHYDDTKPIHVPTRGLIVIVSGLSDERRLMLREMGNSARAKKVDFHFAAPASVRDTICRELGIK